MLSGSILNIYLIMQQISSVLQTSGVHYQKNLPRLIHGLIDQHKQTNTWIFFFSVKPIQ